MELSGIELRNLINEINVKINSGYYVSSIVGITRDSILLKLRHSLEPDISLMLSVNGVWLTRFKFKQSEDNDLVRTIRREIERARIEAVSQKGSERIINLRFGHHDGATRIIVVETFGIGNIVLCNEKMQILAVLNPIQVRHRALKKGYAYSSPPVRGVDVLDLTLEQLKALRDTTELKHLDVLRWLGRNVSIPKKFVEWVVQRAEISAPNIGHLSDSELSRIYEHISNLTSKINSGNLWSVLIRDEKGKARDAVIETSSISRNGNLKFQATETAPYMAAVDEVLTNDIMDRVGNAKTTELDEQIAIIEHDIEEQNKAKEQVISKSSSIRNVAHRLMSTVTDADSPGFDDGPLNERLASDSAYIVLVKGKKYLQVSGERVPVGDSSYAKISSLLFERAKELEKASYQIDIAKTKLSNQLGDLRSKASGVQNKIALSEQTSNEWYERYRWFITSEGLLSIGGRDSTSNSAIIRKYLTENDLVFHAEVYGSPFFILKDAKQANQIRQSLVEVAQATVSFSRAWKDGLSSADAYWVEPGQIKRGAPTGQFLPRGSFVVEGKRNYIKGIEIGLSIGIAKRSTHYVLLSGPSAAIMGRSVIYSRLAPGGFEPNTLAKKLKSELVKVAIARLGAENPDGQLSDYLKSVRLEDLVRACPPGNSKILVTEKGESEAIPRRN